MTDKKRKGKAAQSEEPEESPAKRAKAAQAQSSSPGGKGTKAESVVPAGKLATPQGHSNCSSSVPPKPSSKETPAGTDVIDMMRKCITWVKYHLRAALRADNSSFKQFTDSELHEHLPLAIKKTLAQGELSSFKPPWSCEDAQAAIDSTKMYEASGSLMWCSPFPDGPTARILAGDPARWPQVVTTAETLFDFTPPDSGSASVNGCHRIIFPITVPIHIERGSSLQCPFKGSLRVISGHVFIYAWWWAMFIALEAGNQDRVAALWQCALTVTMHVRYDMSSADLAEFSILQSELRKDQDRAAG